jgi:hypothetical protein
VLGAMNFGKIGRTTQHEATAIVDAALEAGINPHRHRGYVQRRRVRADGRHGHRRPP